MSLVYLFTRNKKTGRKKIVEQMDIEEARKICKRENSPNNKLWYEFTAFKEYAED